MDYCVFINGVKMIDHLYQELKLSHFSQIDTFLIFEIILILL